MISSPRHLAALILFLLIGSVQAGTSLTETRSTLEKWVETRQLVSKTHTDWQTDKETIEQTIRYAMELDVFSIQVSLAAPYPGTELYEMARQNGWFAKKDKTDIIHDDGIQQSTLAYPGLSKDEIFESVEKFYRRYYLRPKPILRIIKTMLEDKDICVRRLREGYEFFKSMAQRRSDLEASRSSAA